MGCIRDSVGSDYVGTISSTVTERECQRWDDQAPHQHDFTDSSVYPDPSIPDAQNFCRNLDDDPNGLWCFTNDPNIRRQTCNIPLCRGILDFYRPHPKDDGRQYFQSVHTCGGVVPISGPDRGGLPHHRSRRGVPPPHQQSKHLLRGGRCAFCVQAGGLSCQY